MKHFLTFPKDAQNPRRTLVYSFYYSFILVFSLAVTRDIYFERWFNATVALIAALSSFFGLWQLHYKKRDNFATNLVMVIAIIPIFILIAFNKFANMSIIFVVLMPLASFFLFTLKKALYFTAFIYSALIIMLYLINIYTPNNNVFALINIFFASIFVLFFGVFYQLSITKAFDRLTQSNDQKEILLNEVHHRVKNNLNVIASLVGLQAINEGKDVKAKLNDTKQRIETIALVHDMLYNQDTDFSNINFEDYARLLSNQNKQMYTLDTDVAIHISANTIFLPVSITLQLGLILNELLTNSFKYAFKNQDKPLIHIVLNQKNEKFTFSYYDNGVGIDTIETLDMTKTLGIKLIKLSVQQMGAELDMYSSNGLHYDIYFEDIS